MRKKVKVINLVKKRFFAKKSEKNLPTEVKDKKNGV